MWNGCVDTAADRLIVPGHSRLGPHLLTAMLANAPAAGARARVISVSSGGMYAQRQRS